jgi:hypothetical protein
MVPQLEYAGQLLFHSHTKKESYILDNLIEDKITLDKKFVSTFYNQIRTPFQEITTVLSPSIESSIRELRKSILKRNYSEKLNFKALADSLYDFINENWDTTKSNLVLHSAGFDSRIVSHFIRQVYLKKGGNVKFLCLEPEVKLFYPIMKYEEWSEDQFFTFDVLAEKKLFDFKELWKPVNGCSGFPQNFIYYIVNNFITDISNTNIWAAIFFNEAFEFRKSLIEFVTKMYYSRHFCYPSSIENKPKFIIPLLNFTTLKLIFEGEFSKDNRVKLLRYLDPKLLEIPNVTIPQLQKFYNISLDLFNPIVQDFQKSFYYNKIDKNIILRPTMIKNETMWTKITLASFIEHLIERNVSISFKGDI